MGARYNTYFDRHFVWLKYDNTLEVLKLWGTHPGGGAVDCMIVYTFVLNEIWVQDTTYILIGNLLG
jgi:hypothetical protein